ncbi:hypothetical protein F5Y06DRAFT_287548 [Hypoxylon sp. FL0890]|nr:hypothetical protein F5Y06DRAFT_287548 [Hypoxylon sp. FL0890]
MAAAVQIMRSSASSNHQQEHSTAPVLEFACLFTRDLRRKQKRWQDGRLKYHTFNKRIMVYDERGNFAGDTHWREDYDLGEGDEVELERGGVIVQVAECTGSRDQDLSELIDKRAHERAERQAAALARRQPALEAATTPHATTPHFQLRHKPLHHLIGTPTGHHGRARIPTESPYEERQKLPMSPQIDSPRPAKRMRREVSPPNKGGYAQSLFGAALTLSGTPTSTPLVRNRPTRAAPVPVESQRLAAPESSHQRTRGHVMENASLRPSSANLSSRCSGQDEVNPRLREESNGFRDVFPTVASRRKRIENSSSTFRSKTMAQSQGLSLDLKLGDRANSPDSTEEHGKLTQEQPVREPRIELRIRPRKKRGLLMISESIDSANSSSSRTKGRTVHQSPPTSLGDAIMGGLNKGVLDKDESMDIGTGGTGHFRRKERSIVDSRESAASDAGPDLLCNAPSPKSKSKSGRRTETRKRRREHSRAEDSEDALDTPNLAIHDESPEEIEPRARHGTVGDGRTRGYDPAHEDVILIETTNSSRSRKQSIKKKKRASIEDITDPCSTTEKYDGSQCENESAWLDGVPAPRLAQLGRKSIRSREVIGLIFDEEMDYRSGHPPVEGGNRGSQGGLSDDLITNHSSVHSTTSEENRINLTITTNTGRAGNNDQLHDPPPAREAGIAEANITAKSIECRNVAVSHVGTTSRLPQEQTRSASAQIDGNFDVQAQAAVESTATRQASMKKVINPATRGKKAAKPSDAAGQVPRCPLPSEVAVGKVLQLGKLENNRGKSRQETRTKEATITPMPGFARANGGPWSREAYDLFGFTRPP